MPKPWDKWEELMAKAVLTPEIIGQIKKALEDMQGKEIELAHPSVGAAAGPHIPLGPSNARWYIAYSTSKVAPGMAAGDPAAAANKAGGAAKE